MRAVSARGPFLDLLPPRQAEADAEEQRARVHAERERIERERLSALPTPATHAILRLVKAGECIRHFV